jgi:hypothetical protein
MSSLRINARSIGAPAALGAVLLLSGAVNAHAGNDDAGPFSAIGSAIGVTSSEGTIDYRERPKLVVPPDRKSLPEPKADAGARPPSFPVDQGSSRRQGARAVSGEPTSPDEPARQSLEQPPYGYRVPSKNATGKNWDKQEAKSWWNPMKYLGSSSDSAAQAPAAAPTQTAAGPTALATPGAAAAEAPEGKSWWNPMRYLGPK